MRLAGSRGEFKLPLSQADAPSAEIPVAGWELGGRTVMWAFATHVSQLNTPPRPVTRIAFSKTDTKLWAVAICMATIKDYATIIQDF
jgi:hypothetical protein